MPALEELRARFSRDLYATELTGVQILEAKPGWALCSLRLRPDHMNSNHVPMGGAVFTLADLAFAVAANGVSDERDSITQHVSITFLSPARGKELLAEARCIRDGRSTDLYEVDVKDELGVHVAHVTVNGFHIKK